MTDGRWPSNVILSPDMAEVIDGMEGGKSYNPEGAFGTTKRQTGHIYGNGASIPVDGKIIRGYGDRGGASRFFLTAGYEPWELEWIIANGLTPCGT